MVGTMRISEGGTRGMDEAPKGHHGTSGIIPVFLIGEDVHRLHQFAIKHGIETDQLAASLLMRSILRAWTDGKMTFDIKQGGL